jgi:dTDP-4-amino-4,6-dideoxygalactose transaminase
MARLSERTRAIMVTHISGLPCDMDAIMEVARARNIPVIEDCAQAHGAMYKGRHVGTIGAIGAFSTMFGKHHATGGQGGIVYTQSEELYWKVRRAADRGKPFGLEGVSSNVTASLNLNTEELSCAIGRVQLEKLPRFVEARRAFAMAITHRCKQSLKTFRAMEALPGSTGSFWFMFIKIDVEKISATKTELVAALREQGIPFESGYWHSPIDQEWFKKHHAFGTSGFPWSSPEYKGDLNAIYELPNARAAEACHIRLLMHENCGEQEVEDVIAALQIVEARFAK